jgi:hypothetical protein
MKKWGRSYRWNAKYLHMCDKYAGKNGCDAEKLSDKEFEKYVKYGNRFLER